MGLVALFVACGGGGGTNPNSNLNPDPKPDPNSDSQNNNNNNTDSDTTNDSGGGTDDGSNPDEDQDLDEDEGDGGDADDGAPDDGVPNDEDNPGDDGTPDDGDGDAGDGGVDPAAYASYCGTEADFPAELKNADAPVQFIASNTTNHNLLTEIIFTVSGGIDIATLNKNYITVTENSATTKNYTVTWSPSVNGVDFKFKNGADGKKAWRTSSSYKITLCRQIKTTGAKNIQAAVLTVSTRAPNVEENIGLSHSNGARSGLFYLPAGYDPGKPYPLILLLHGLGGDGNWMIDEFKTVADQYGAILLGPDGFERPHFEGGTSYYFNPNHKTENNNPPQDFIFVMDCLDKIFSAFTIDPTHIMVAGMSMGAPVSLFFTGNTSLFTHGAMLHGVVWNYDPNEKNDVLNVYLGWEQTPFGESRPPLWYSSSETDKVTNYKYGVDLPLTADTFDFPVLVDAGFDIVPHDPADPKKATGFGYGKGDSINDSHKIYPDEKIDLMEWFINDVLPN